MSDPLIPVEESRVDRPVAAPLAETPAAEPSVVEAAEQSKLPQYQRAFLLQQLLDAVPHHRLSKGDANKKMGRTVEKQLQLNKKTANQLREQLAQEGHIRITKEGSSAAYELTDQGREYLQTLVPYPEPEEEEVSPEMLLVRRSCLLLQLLKTPGYQLKKREANQLKGMPKATLDLKVSAANRLRLQLAQEGLLEIIRSARSESYRLTPAGRNYLGTHGQFPHTRLQINGEAINELLQAARSAHQLAPAAPVAATEPSAEQARTTVDDEAGRAADSPNPVAEGSSV